MVLEEVLPLEAGGLAFLLRDPEASARTLVLDCRPFLSFCQGHLLASRPVPWNGLLRRRRSRGRSSSRLSLEGILPDRALLARLRRGEIQHLVVLDEAAAGAGEDGIATLRPDGLARILLDALLTEERAGTSHLYLLTGGFENFQANFPELCSTAPTPLNASPPPPPPLLRSPEDNATEAMTPSYDQGGPVEILPFLYLGSCFHSSNREVLESLGITAVLNVSSSCPNYFEGQFLYKSIPVEDNQMAEISVWFQEAINFIDSVKNGNGRVLVHCQAGISRSATICLAYLIQSRRVRLEEAFDFVKQRRGVISPNFGFMGQLLQFETEVLCH
ncbi:dual specificity protein phosphatase 2 [Sceloporus undulatus]|uniref:dual specificity protein phosphatase 2 n=1 Tax=Sceloporus undulatus TaxID=8520 RepID=UPI001C4C70F1|nr:dual specificity protein phosphatase 2 [Sceloporus undulatus]